MSILSAQVTPLFPIYLSLFSERKLAMIAIVIMSFMVLLLVYLITLNFSSHKIALISVIILSVEPSFYASSLNLATETLFTLFLVLGIYFTTSKPFSNNSINLLLQAILLGVSVLVRPVALIAILALSLLYLVYFIKTSKKIYFGSIFLVLTPSIIWSYRNFFTHGFFNVSLMPANNIFVYDGVASLSIAEDITFEEAGKIESDLKVASLGPIYSIKESYDYDNNRGFELITEHPISALILHCKGLFKTSFGVFKSKFFIIVNEIYRIDSKILTGIILLALGLLIVCIWILTFYGIRPALKTDSYNTMLILILIVSVILPATSHVAYARFRAPVAPLISIVAALGLNQLLQLSKSRNKDLSKLK
jgi:4-amino-4-deoxy-L-arabinose transferase-like glycosyltransferase